MKKISCLALTVVILIISLSAGAFSAVSDVAVTYASAELPEIIVNAYVNDETASKSDVSLNYDGSNVQVSSFSKFSKDEHTRRVFFVVDLSSSMSDQCFQEAKNSINSFADKMGSNTYVYVISFGEEVKLEVANSNDASVIKEAVNSLENNGGKTKLFAAVKEAIDVSNNCAQVDMQYAVVFSDGEDFQTGDTTKNEVEAALKNSSMPVYAMCADTGSASSSDIGAFRELATESRGLFYLYDGTNASEQFSKLNNYVESQYVIKGSSSNNVFKGSTQLVFIKVNDIQSQQVSVVSKSRTDAEKPEIVSSPTINSEDNLFRFEFSEDVINASGDKPTKDDVILRTSAGKEVKLSDANYSNKDGQYYFTVYTEKPIVKDEYTLILKGLTDNSIEKNKLDEEFSFESEIGISKATEFFINYWYIFVIILVVLLLVIIMLVMMRRKNVKSVKQLFIDETINEVEVKHIINSEQGRKLCLIIDSGNGLSKKVDFTLSGSAIFGRADICNVVFDDAKMSRQHFCIGEDDGRIVLSDLETTNGTYLNGVIVKTPQVLKSGDRIFAGLSTITVEFTE